MGLLLQDQNTFVRSTITILDQFSVFEKGYKLLMSSSALPLLIILHAVFLRSSALANVTCRTSKEISQMVSHSGLLLNSQYAIKIAMIFGAS